METIPKDEVSRIICKHCIKVNKICQHRWDCPLLTEIAKYKDEPSDSEKPNNCEHITEDGVTCAKYPACDDCLDNPLNKVKGSERLIKGSEQTDLVEDSPSLVEDLVEDEPQTDIHDLTDCDFCKDRNCKDCEGGKDEPQTERSE